MHIIHFKYFQILFRLILFYFLLRKENFSKLSIITRSGCLSLSCGKKLLALMFFFLKNYFTSGIGYGVGLSEI